MNITIDNKKYEALDGETVLDVARRNNIYIPTLCFLKNINETSDCRMCIVKVDGINNYVSSCSLKVKDEMIIYTDIDEIKETRKTILDLIVSNHHFDCNNCNREGKCELKKVMFSLDFDVSKYSGVKNTYEVDSNSPSITKDLNKCILCKRCISTCNKIQNINAINVMNRGFTSCVNTFKNNSLNDVNCTFCGQCINNCPTGALSETKAIDKVTEAINDPEKIVFVQTAPSIRAALGEEFGYDIGTNVTGKMVNALKILKFDYVFDTNVGADFTIMEEAWELVERIQNNETMPMITSCSPAWVRFIEMNYPELLSHISSCKSPHQMLGALIKTYFAKVKNIDPKNMFIVSVMPCISKKFEITRDTNKVDGYKDVDAVITTRELAKMIKKNNIDFKSLEDMEFDNPLGEATGAGAIFGNTGGVMEAALRTAKDLLGETSEKIIFEEVRGEKGIKAAKINLKNNEYNIVVASGLANARKILEDISSKKAKYDFIEIMACPGGCIMGGGQPIVPSNIKDITDVRSLRASVLYNIDDNSTYRKSHENPILQKIYLDYIGKPGKELSHKILHTEFNKRNKYNIK